MPTPGNSINEATTGICGFTGIAFTSTAATNHAVMVGGSTSSTLTNIGPTAISGQVLQSAGASADPAFSTATYPATTTINQLLYSSAANVIGGLTTANNGTLVTSSAGAPSILAGPGTTGNVLQANAAAAPSFSTATYPSTTTINQVLYSSAANVIGGLTTANNGTFVTSSAGVPSILAGPGTTGNVLQANAAAAPSFSTATYPSTTTINQLLYSSAANVISGLATGNNGILITSNTGVPSLLAAGTTGQVLIATTGSPPSWGAPPSSFTPNSVIQIFEEFLGVASSLYNGNFNWTGGAAGAWTGATGSADSGHPGVIASASLGGATSQFLSLSGSGGGAAIIGQNYLGGGAIILNWVIKIVNLSTVTNTYTLRIGFGDTQGAAQANGVYFEYTNGVNSGQWQYITAAASTRTTSNSSTAVTTGWHNLGITINAAGTSCAFTVDGISLGTANTTNIPTLGITPLIDILRSAGTVAAGSILVDLMYFTQTLTTPR